MTPRSEPSEDNDVAAEDSGEDLIDEDMLR